MSINPDDLSTLQRLIAIKGYRDLHAVINGLDIQIEWAEPARAPTPVLETITPAAPSTSCPVHPDRHYLRSPTVGRPEPDMFRVAVGDWVIAGQTVVVLAQGDSRVAVCTEVTGRISALRDYGATELVHHGHWLLVIEPDPEPIT